MKKIYLSKILVRTITSLNIVTNKVNIHVYVSETALSQYIENCSIIFLLLKVLTIFTFTSLILFPCLLTLLIPFDVNINCVNLPFRFTFTYLYFMRLISLLHESNNISLRI